MKCASCLLFMLCISTAVLGQSVVAPSTPPVAAGGSFFAMYVANLDSSIAWYSTKLGLSVVFRSAKSDGVAVALLEGPGLTVELIEYGGGVEPSKSRSASDPLFPTRGLFKAGVIVDDFDQTLALLKQRGVEIAFGPFPARADQRANVIIRDNSGNLIQFIGDRAE
ncbi:MAG: VOC family protein [Acidobacteria bacterium]|nr:VOC family protein [Acidobacteriota bacterium]